MLEYTWPILHQAEKLAEGGSVHVALRGLRQLSLLDFGQFFLTLPNPHFPHLSRLLPSMASDEVQRAWTGAEGIHLLSGTVDFMRMMKANFEDICHRPLDGARVLDYGCGYGRITRLLYRYIDPETYVGVDPWTVSLDLCRIDGLLGNFVQSDYLPETLPVGPDKFDLAFAFSVFTHTSLNATLTGLRALRRHIKPNGLLVITIRPVEYWSIVARITDEERSALMERHRAEGFAFVSDGAVRAGDEETFGDTTITLDWFATHVPEWHVERVDRGLDGWQIVVMLSPA